MLSSTCDGSIFAAIAACCLAFCCFLKASTTATAAFFRSSSCSFPTSLLLPVSLSDFPYYEQYVSGDNPSPTWTYFSCGVTRMMTRHRFSVLLASSNRLRILAKSSLVNGHFALSQIGLNRSFTNKLGLSFSLVVADSPFLSRPFAASTLPCSSLKRVWQ